jgi:hypothetical protein
MAALLPDAVLYEDAELTAALVEARAPLRGHRSRRWRVSRPSPPSRARASGPARPVAGQLALPPAGAALRRNPLYGEDGRLSWPSERYGREYGPRATYPARAGVPESAVLGPHTAEAARRRELLDLPERW